MNKDCDHIIAIDFLNGLFIPLSFKHGKNYLSECEGYNNEMRLLDYCPFCGDKLYE